MEEERLAGCRREGKARERKLKETRRGARTEEHVLEYYWLLGEPAKVAVIDVPVRRIDIGDGLAFDARPGEVNVEEQEEDA